MPDRIIIEGSTIRHERVETLAEAPLESISQHLVRRIATTLPILPAHPVRYLHFDGDNNRGLVVVEQAPGLRHIRVEHHTGRYAEDEQRRTEGRMGIWRVQFPWQYFAFPFRTSLRDGRGNMHDFTIDGTFLYWARDQLHGPEDPIIAAPVPNVGLDGGVCWGSTRATSASLAERIDEYINSFSQTTFNEDMGHFTPFDNSLTAWENNSPADNPMAWRTWPIWETRQAINVTQIPFAHPQQLPPMAELNPSYIELPEPPANFTFARAREYLASLTPAARQRLIAAGRAFDDEQPEAVAIHEETAA